MAKYYIDKKWEDSFARFRRAYNLVGNIISNTKQNCTGNLQGDDDDAR